MTYFQEIFSEIWKNFQVKFSRNFSKISRNLKQLQDTFKKFKTLQNYHASLFKIFRENIRIKSKKLKIF